MEWELVKEVNLYFENSSGTERLIASCVTGESEAVKIIKKFCKERNFTIYYYRISEKYGVKTFDVGSHTEFFHLKNEEENK